MVVYGLFGVSGFIDVFDSKESAMAAQPGRWRYYLPGVWTLTVDLKEWHSLIGEGQYTIRELEVKHSNCVK